MIACAIGIFIGAASALGAASVLGAGPGSKPEGELASKMQLLYDLGGRWITEEDYKKCESLPEGMVGRGSARFEQAIEDYYVLLEYSSKTDEWKLEGHGVFTYDEVSSQYRYWWFANLGQPRSFTGTYRPSGRSLVFVDDAKSGEVQRHTFKFTSDDEMEFTMESSPDGKEWRVDVVTNYSRKGKHKDEEAPPQQEKKPKAVRG